MDNTNALPTTLGAVEAWLRSLTTPEAIETGGYAYLFGMATVKLADAHREIARLQAEKESR